MSNHRVISIEDEQGIFDLIKTTLSSLPIDLYHAQTGQEAIDLIEDILPDLLVLDITLPDIHGWDVVKHVKKMESNQPEIVVLTARADPTHRLIGRLQDVSKYMCKPFVPSELRQSVSDILGLA